MLTLKQYWREHAIEQILAVLHVTDKAGVRAYLNRLSDDEVTVEFRETMASMDAAREPYKVIGDNYICVCANCFPGRRIAEIFPELAGCEISHGICPGHAKRYLKEAAMLMAAKKESELVAV